MIQTYRNRIIYDSEETETEYEETNAKYNMNNFTKEDIMKIDMVALYMESAIEILKEKLEF